VKKNLVMTHCFTNEEEDGGGICGLGCEEIHLLRVCEVDRRSIGADYVYLSYANFRMYSLGDI